MMSYDECKTLAEERAKERTLEINRAYKLGFGFVFDNKDIESVGTFPLVVDRKSGELSGLWAYLEKNKLSMDDMKEIKY